MQEVNGYKIDKVIGEDYYYGHNADNSFAFYKNNNTILFSPYGKTLSDEEELNILTALGFLGCTIKHFNLAEWKELDMKGII